MLLLLLCSHSLGHYHRQLMIGCHGESYVSSEVVTMVIIELDCEQNGWPEMRLLRDKESKMK